MLQELKGHDIDSLPAAERKKNMEICSEYRENICPSNNVQAHQAALATQIAPLDTPSEQKRNKKNTKKNLKNSLKEPSSKKSTRPPPTSIQRLCADLWKLRFSQLKKSTEPIYFGARFQTLVFGVKF